MSNDPTWSPEWPDFDLHPELMTRAGLTEAGASFHPQEGGAEYALLAPSETRPTHILFRMSGDAAVPVAAAPLAADPQRLLRNHQDGRLETASARYFARLDERIARTRSTVRTPLEAAGYEVVDTGGGCLMWMKLVDRATESVLMINNAVGDIDGDPDQPEWIIGRSQGDDWYNIDRPFTLADAISAADDLPAPGWADGRVMEEVFPDLADAVRALRPDATQ